MGIQREGFDWEYLIHPVGRGRDCHLVANPESVYSVVELRQVGRRQGEFKIFVLRILQVLLSGRLQCRGTVDLIKIFYRPNSAECVSCCRVDQIIFPVVDGCDIHPFLQYGLRPVLILYDRTAGDEGSYHAVRGIALRVVQHIFPECHSLQVVISELTDR